MSETKFWTELNAGFRGKWDAERVDNRIAPGFPDVSYGMNGVNGHIELKYLAKWPKNGTVETAKVFGTQFNRQKQWLVDRGECGGHCFLFIWVKDPTEWLLIDHRGLAAMDAFVSVEDLHRTAVNVWVDWINWSGLERALSRGIYQSR